VKEVLALAGKKPADVDLGALADRVSSSLSGGQRQRLALACIPPAKLVIYDEPFAGLDSKSLSAIRSSLQPGSDSTRLILVPRQLMMPL
jgi:ABC-type sulfate/molybdate transport systems ATPase subunit